MGEGAALRQRLRGIRRTVAGVWRDPRARWPRRIALGLAVLLVVPAVTGAVALRAQYAGVPGDDTRTRGRDAYWLGHAWVDGRKNDEDLDAFARRTARQRHP